MRTSRSKACFRAAAISFVTAALTACGGGGSSSVTPTGVTAPDLPNQGSPAIPRELLYVPIIASNSVEVFDAAANGNVAPLFTIATASCGLTGPTGVAVDAHGTIFISNFGAPPFISIVKVTGTTPSLVGVIQGDKTHLDAPDEMAVDTSGNLYVANEHGIITTQGITEYAPGATGNVPPVAQITGSNTDLIGLIGPTGVALDQKNNIFAVMNDLARLVEFPAGSNGNVAPIINVFGANTLLDVSTAVALDSTGRIYVTNGMPLAPTQAVTIYSPGTTGNMAPTAFIGGPHTMLGAPFGIAIDKSGKIYVSDFAEIVVFAPGATGDATPIARISGPETGILPNQAPGFIAVH